MVQAVLTIDCLFHKITLNKTVLDNPAKYIHTQLPWIPTNSDSLHMTKFTSNLIITSHKSPESIPLLQFPSGAFRHTEFS